MPRFPALSDVRLRCALDRRLRHQRHNCGAGNNLIESSRVKSWRFVSAWQRFWSGDGQLLPSLVKEGLLTIRQLLVQGAQHILGPFGTDCDLRRWGLKLAERGGKSGKKRAVIATARKATLPDQSSRIRL